MRKTALIFAILMAGSVLIQPSVSLAAKMDAFVFASMSNYDTMDPHVVFDVSRVAYQLNLYDTLYRWEDNPPKLIPWIAESYTVSPDGYKWTFKLRKGVKFHDGTEVTADDVQYSINRILALKKGPASLLATLVSPEKTKVLDRYTVEFNLDKNYVIFLSTVPLIQIVNKRLVQSHEVNNDWGNKWLNDHDAGSGSYTLEQYDPAVGFVAKRFVDHFLGWKGKPIDWIDFRYVAEVSSRLLGLIKGDILGAESLFPADQLKQLREAKNVQVIDQESMRVQVLHMHNQRPPFNDIHVRKAISYAFDYKGFIHDILKDTVVRNPGPIPNNMWGAPKDLKGYYYDLAKAKEELAKASVKVDRPLNIHYPTDNALLEQAAVLLQDGMNKIGLQTKMVPESWPVITGKASKPETSPDIWSVFVSTYYADPNNWIGEMYNSANWGSWKASSWYKNEKVDKLLAAAMTNPKQSERQQAYETASRIIVEDAPTIWTFNTMWTGPFSKRVGGVRFCPIGNGQEVRWMYFK
jgi:ABC-type transport system substrate-binding protein